jgi:hypothetical protein
MTGRTPSGLNLNSLSTRSRQYVRWQKLNCRGWPKALGFPLSCCLGRWFTPEKQGQVLTGPERWYVATTKKLAAMNGMPVEQMATKFELKYDWLD